MSKDEIVATRATNEVLLHLLKLALYAAFGLLPQSAWVAGALVAVAAVLASLASKRVLALMHESVFRRIGLFAMVASGVAMFSLSGSQIMALHRAWIAFAAPGDEREVQLYWNGTRHLALEREEAGDIVFERTVPIGELPAPVRAALPAIARPADIVMAEEVHGASSFYYEIYYRHAGAVRKVEVSPSGTPRHRALR